MNEKEETRVKKFMIFLSVGELGGTGKIILRENGSINTGNVRNATIKQ